MVEVLAQECPLDYDSRKKQVKTQCAVGVLLEERHQETEADEDHHVGAFEPWKILKLVCIIKTE